ncbi:MAG: proteasome accessory factor PafA2 family protein [bacterium]|nr:proteasome accessory factor PafA2 family protein [bacterium]
MHFPDRVYGLEYEYGIMVADKNGKLRTSIRSPSRLLQPIEHSVLNKQPRTRIWHTNGSCSYVDAGEHPEHATAECRSIREAVIYAKAGDILMNRIFCQPDSEGTLCLFKNNLGYDEDGIFSGFASFGCHENYLLTKTELLIRSPKELIPMLISRQIIDGAGWWQKNGTYLFSQRAICMTHDISPRTMGDRGIITSRSTNDTGRSPRLHLIPGDSNILEFPVYMKLGIGSLVLSLVEGNLCPFIPCMDPVSAMQCIASDPNTLTPYIGTTDENSKSAFEVQTIYLEAARRELNTGTFDSEETEAELKDVALRWEQALNAIFSRDSEWMLGRFDYATKQYLIEKEIKRRNIKSQSQQMALKKDFDIYYHNISDPLLQDRMNKLWASRRIASDQEIQRALYEPPQRTRARMRSQFIHYVREHNLTDRMYLDWSVVGCSYDTAQALKIENPLEFESVWFDAYMSSFSQECKKAFDHMTEYLSNASG